jgi:hypothetical protein
MRCGSDLSAMELRTKYVTYGWEGSEMEAIEFPVDLAKEGIILAVEALRKGKCGLSGKLNVPEVTTLFRYCNDVIENARDGEVTYLLAPIWEEQVREIENIINKLKI